VQREIGQDLTLSATDPGMLNIDNCHNAGFSTPRVELQDTGISSPPCTKD
jgi:hypothetical protein